MFTRFSSLFNKGNPPEVTWCNFCCAGPDACWQLGQVVDHYIWTDLSWTASPASAAQSCWRNAALCTQGGWELHNSRRAVGHRAACCLQANSTRFVFLREPLLASKLWIFQSFVSWMSLEWVICIRIFFYKIYGNENFTRENVSKLRIFPYPSGWNWHRWFPIPAFYVHCWIVGVSEHQEKQYRLQPVTRFPNVPLTCCLLAEQ